MDTLFARQQGFHVGALGRHPKARWTGIGYHRQVYLASELSALPLTDIDQWTNDTNIAGIREVMGFHGLQAPAMKSRHQEALCQIIQMLSECQHIMTVLTSRGVHDTPLHTGTVGAKGSALHMRRSLFGDGLTAVEIGHAQPGHVRLEMRGVESVDLRIHRDGREFKADRRITVKVA